MWIFYAGVAVSVLTLRRKRPDLERPYKCWGYPAVPIVFIVVSLGMTALYIAQSPRTTLPWLGVLLLGFPAYTIWTRLAPPAKMPGS
jgi:APA family basic amino acid/polyamine antiporter